MRQLRQIFAAGDARQLFICPEIVEAADLGRIFLAGIVHHDLNALLHGFLKRRNLGVRHPDRDGDALHLLADSRVDQPNEIGAKIVVARHGQIGHFAAVGLDDQGRIVDALLDLVEERVLRRACDYSDVGGL